MHAKRETVGPTLTFERGNTHESLGRVFVKPTRDELDRLVAQVVGHTTTVVDGHGDRSGGRVIVEAICCPKAECGSTWVERNKEANGKAYWRCGTCGHDWIERPDVGKGDQQYTRAKLPRSRMPATPHQRPARRGPSPTTVKAAGGIAAAVALMALGALLSPWRQTAPAAPIAATAPATVPPMPTAPTQTVPAAPASLAPVVAAVAPTPSPTTDDGVFTIRVSKRDRHLTDVINRQYKQALSDKPALMGRIRDLTLHLNGLKPDSIIKSGDPIKLPEMSLVYAQRS
jgi:hypothetical protein